MFRDRLPQISAGQPDNIAVQTSFGWTEDDATIDDTIAVDSPRWRAALGNNTVQAAGSLSNSAWHDGNAVSFTINNLRETLTKNLQPLTQVPIDPRAKTYESNKTLNYAVQAQALALFRYYDMTDSGSVPGFRRDAILSNFQQTPLPAKPGTPVVFEFDINAINFESGTSYVNFGLVEDPQTSEYAFFSHGELSEIETGWRVRIPWTATPLNSTSGLVTAFVQESSDPAISAFAEENFQVPLDQQNNKSTTVNIQDVSPDPIEVSQSTDVHVSAQLGSTGYNSPSYSWIARFVDDRGNLLLEQTGQTANIDFTRNIEGLASNPTTKVTVTISATTTEAGGSTGGTVAGTGGGGGNGDGASVASADKLVAVNQRTQLKLSVLNGSEEIAVGYPSTVDEEISDKPTEQARRNALIKLRRDLLKKTLEDRPDNWQVQLEGASFIGTPPETVTVQMTPSASSALARPLKLKKTTVNGNTVYRGGLFDNLNQSPVRRTTEESVTVQVNSTRVPANTTYFEVHGYFRDDDVSEKNAQLNPPKPPVSVEFTQFVAPLARFVSNILGSKFLPPPYVQLGRIDEEVSESLTESFPRKIDRPEISMSSKENYLLGGFETITFIYNAQFELVEASVKVRHPANTMIVMLHGLHDGTILPVNDSAGDRTTFNPKIAAEKIDPTPENIPPSVSNLAFISCGALDLRDYNNFYASDFVSTVPGNLQSGKHLLTANTATRQLFGGEPWFKAGNENRTKKVNLLGYNGFAPFIGTDAVMDLFRRRLDGGESFPVAWLKANREIALNPVNGRDYQYWLCLNACAFDQDNYYFIQYPVDRTIQDIRTPLAAAVKLGETTLWRVPRANWDQVPGKWEEPVLGQIGQDFK